MTAPVISAPQLVKFRSANQWSRAYLAIYKPNVIYTALLNGAPASTDMVGELSFDGGSGTLADVKAEMTLWVGSEAGKKDLGVCRIRKAPISGTFYIGFSSDVDWVDNCYLTVVDFAMLNKKPLLLDDGVVKMDGEHAYSDQHEDFAPMPVMLPHAVAWLTGADVDVTFDASDAWVFDSTIASYAWSAPNSVSITGGTSATPTITYNAAGYYAVYCTVTAANGKSATGVRYVMVFDAENPPHKAEVNSPYAYYETGGWAFSAKMYFDADPNEILEGALCILLSEDWYAGEKTSIGQIAGRENIVTWGYIAGESIEWDPQTGNVEFTVQGAHDWLKQINTSPFILKFAKSTPDAWDVMPELTVDRALWHILHWRSNASALLDIQLTGDERYTPDVQSMEGSLWGQLKEIVWNKIFGRVGCDRYGRFWAVIEPQLVPEADRTWNTVMTLTKKDWQDKVNINRAPFRKLAMQPISGWLVDASGAVSTLYSLGIGHIGSQHGEVGEPIDKLLAESQTQLNQLAGLYVGWQNNQLPEMTFRLAQNNRMIDCFPNQFLDVSLAAQDTPRGILYAGNLIPRDITLHYDVEALCWTPEIVFEAETFAEVAVNGDIPASTGIDDFDMSFPPSFDLPDLPLDLGELIYAPPTEPNSNHPKVVVIASSNFGVLYTTDFDADNPTWQTMNNGLSSTDISDIYNLVVTKSGAVYVHLYTAEKVMRASAVGGTFVEVANASHFATAYGEHGIHSIAVNPSLPDQILIAGLGYFEPIVSVPSRVRLCTNGVLGSQAGEVRLKGTKGTGQFINGKWYVMGSRYDLFSGAWLCRYSAGGGLEYDGTIGTALGQDAAVRYSQPLSNTIFQWDDSGAGGFNIISNLSGTPTATRNATFTPAKNVQGFAFSPTGTHGMGADTDVAIRPYKTTDGGASFSIMTGTIPVGSDIWENCKDNYRWIFGGGTTIRITTDQGATYVNKMGNLGYIAALIDITAIRYIR
jgi:hypothetical protein